MEDSSMKSQLNDYAQRELNQQIDELFKANDPAAHYGVALDFFRLLVSKPRAAHWLADEPSQAIPALEDAIRKAQDQRSREAGNSGGVKQLVHPRIDAFRIRHGELRPAIGQLRARHAGRLLILGGTVIRAGQVRMREQAKQYECKKCHGKFNVAIDGESGELAKLPERCPVITQCGGKSFEQGEGSLAIDHQEVRVQERMERLRLGTTPRCVTAILEGDLVDSVQAGDDVEIVGYLSRRFRSLKSGQRPDLELVFVANNARRRNHRSAIVDIPAHLRSKVEAFWSSFGEVPMAGRDAIIASICPKVKGCFHAKLAVALCLLGGSPHRGVRNESHVLLLGDPGTGKSQLLRFASQLSSRSVCTTGSGSTSAGLTVTATKDAEGQWGLEAGALVLADGGLCCVDELTALRSADRASVLEAMEQQTLSIAKAGLVTRLSARASLLGAANPKRPFDPFKSLAENTHLPAPLLSRFDCCPLLLDRRSRGWDEAVADHILASHRQTKGQLQFPSTPASNSASFAWSLEDLRSYFALARESFQPALTERAEKVLQGYYRLQRKKATERATVRMLEGLVRLSQAHAKLCFRSSAETADATVAILLVEGSSPASSALPGDIFLASEFAPDPDADVVRAVDAVEKLIASEIGLERDSAHSGLLPAKRGAYEGSDGEYRDRGSGREVDGHDHDEYGFQANGIPENGGNEDDDDEFW